MAGSSTINTWDYTGEDFIINGNANATSTLTATSNIVLANIPGMSVNLVAGGTYMVDIMIVGVSAAAGGINLKFAGNGTASAVNITTWNYNGTTLNAVTNITALSSSLTTNAAQYTNIQASGVLTVGVGGSFTLQAAQNTGNGTSSTVLFGSYMTFTRIS